MKSEYAKKRFAPGSSRGPRSRLTLLQQMERDLQRGARIRDLREPIPQPAIAEKVGVTLRAYQEWEAGGGIKWENVLRLARVLGADPDFILGGAERLREQAEREANQQPADSLLQGLDAKVDQLAAKLDTLLEIAVAWEIQTAAAEAEGRLQGERKRANSGSGARAPARRARAR